MTDEDKKLLKIYKKGFKDASDEIDNEEKYEKDTPQHLAYLLGHIHWFVQKTDKYVEFVSDEELLQIFKK